MAALHKRMISNELEVLTFLERSAELSVRGKSLCVSVCARSCLCAFVLVKVTNAFFNCWYNCRAHRDLLKISETCQTALQSQVELSAQYKQQQKRQF